MFKKMKIGLALGSGAARGLAHIGVLQVLEENNIPIDIIVGTSMGAVLGGLYSVGYSSQELEQITKSLNWSGLFADAPSRKNLFLAQKEMANKEFITIRFR